jgi:phospholipid/cholesterol/gamma-HCH transport system substrate-binding protein
MRQATSREIRVGLVVVLALFGLMALLALAGGGPGFLSSRQIIDVVFRDGQGIRVGSAVRVAGLDAGRVVGLDLTEREGSLLARVRISLPNDLAAKLRQDVKITIQASITGQNCVNVVSSGRSAVALVPGQVVQGVETSFFDPILEQVGLGPVERSHLSHTIAEVRQTADVVGPRLRQILGALQDTTAGLRDTAGVVRPAIESTAGHFDELARHLGAAAPRLEMAIARLDGLTNQMEGLLVENRPNLQATLASVRDLSATFQDILARDRGEIDNFLVGINRTRQRADRVLYQTDLLTTQGVEILTRNRANMERTFTNVRDATDWGHQLVEKLYGNPFYLSPFYKPTPEDKRSQLAFDNAHALIKGVRELNDVVKTIEAIQAKPGSEAQQQELAQLYKTATSLRTWLDQTTRQLAADLQTPRSPRR